MADLTAERVSGDGLDVVEVGDAGLVQTPGPTGTSTAMPPTRLVVGAALTQRRCGRAISRVSTRTGLVSVPSSARWMARRPSRTRVRLTRTGGQGADVVVRGRLGPDHLEVAAGRVPPLEAGDRSTDQLSSVPRLARRHEVLEEVDLLLGQADDDLLAHPMTVPCWDPARRQPSSATR